MNDKEPKSKTPKFAGWHWWKPTSDGKVIDILVTDSDIASNKFKNFGGEWHHFPTFNEVSEYRSAYVDLYQRAKVNETRMRELELVLNKFVEFMGDVSKKTFTPKSEIKEFLEKVSKGSNQEPPQQ